MKLYTRIKLFLLFLLVFSANSLLAQVSITQATGGQNISVHKAIGGSAEGYTNIGTFTIEDQAVGQFVVGSNRVIQLRPSVAHWQIKPTAGVLTFGGTNITAASMVVESDKITITYTVVGATADDNFIRVAGIEVKSTTTAREAAGSLRRITSGVANSGTITGFGNNEVVAPLSEAVGNFVKLLVTLPGETYDAGTPTGKTGTPTNINAGTAATATIRAVDDYWNVVDTAPTDVVGLSGNDAGATYQANAALSSGIRTRTVTLRGLGVTTITASDIDDGTKTSGTTTVTVVSAGFTKLLTLLPNENFAPGTATGKTNTPTAQTAGDAFTVTVRAVDAGNNLVNTITDEIHLTTTDANATMPANVNMVDGVAEFTTSVTLITAGNRTITATNVTDNNKTASTSTTIAVTAGAFVKLQLILPGETAAPGTLTGKTGTPNQQTAGVAFTATVRAVDAYFNLKNNPYPTDVIEVKSNNVNGVITAPAALASGVRTRTVTLYAAGVITITTNDVTNGGIISDSNDVTVVNGSYAKLQILLLGEDAAPGTPSGKTNSPTAQTAGTPFTVRVIAVDAAWNPITGITDEIELTTSDANATMPAKVAMVNGVATFTSSVTLITAGSRTITATNVTDNTKTANTSANVTVQTGAYAKLVVLMPNQSLAPGTLTGISGSPIIPDRGTPFDIRIRAVDAYFNTVSTAVNTHILSFSSPGNTMPANIAMVNNNYRTSSVNILLPGPQNVTITDTNTGFFVTITVPGPNPASLITDHFRSVASGLWTNSANWESSTDGVNNWHPSTLTPTSGSATITVRNGNTLNITTTISLDQVTIQYGGKIEHQAGTLTIANGGGPVDFQVDGVLSSGSGITKTGVLRVGATGRYQHAYTTATGTIPAADWQPGSVCEVIGYTSFVGAITGSNQSFSTFEWNAPDQSIANNGPNLANGFSADNFTVTSTGSGVLYIGTSGGTINIGNYTQSDGSVVINRSSNTLALNITGNFSVANGNFTKGAGASTINFNGAANQSLSATSVNGGSGLSFWSVNFAGGSTKTLTSGSFNVATTGVLTMSAATTLNANGNLTILSDAASSGRVAAIPAGSAITGNVTVQRFLTGGAINPYRTYRDLSSPIHEGSNTYSLNQFKDDILVTGNALSGFDQPKPTPTSTSALTYNGTAWVFIPNINTGITAGHGIHLMFTGNRTNALAKVTPPFVNPEDVTMDFVGALNQQNVTVALTPTMTLLGNPYASTIDWNLVTKTNLIDNVVSSWNPATRQYSTYNSTNGSSANGGSRYIATGQGFFVNSNSGSLTFKEGDKVANVTPTLLMSAPTDNDQNLVATANKLMVAGNETPTTAANKLMATNNTVGTLAAPETELRLWLQKENTPFKVETVMLFKDGASGNFVRGEDAIYNVGQEVYMSSIAEDNSKLVINYMPAVASNTKVKLDLPNNNATGNYTLSLNYKNVPAGYLVHVNDNFTGTSQVLQNGESYTFAIDKTQATSFGADRLSVSFEPPTTLPVELSSFSATKVSEGVLVKWSTLTEVNNDRFEIERAGDDNSFVKLHTETAKGSGSIYSFIDRSPLLGNNYYRLVQFDKNSMSNVSGPLWVNYTGPVTGTNAVSIYPNPIVAAFTIKYNGALKASQQTVKVIDATGKVLFTKIVAKQELIQGCEFNMASYAAGMYVVEVYENGNQKVGQTKLIKQ